MKRTELKRARKTGGREKDNKENGTGRRVMGRLEKV